MRSVRTRATTTTATATQAHTSCRSMSSSLSVLRLGFVFVFSHFILLRIYLIEARIHKRYEIAIYLRMDEAQKSIRVYREREQATSSDSDSRMKSNLQIQTLLLLMIDDGWCEIGTVFSLSLNVRFVSCLDSEDENYLSDDKVTVAHLFWWYIYCVAVDFVACDMPAKQMIIIPHKVISIAHNTQRSQIY